MVTRVHRPHAVPRVHVTRLSMIIHDLDLAWPVVAPTEASAPMRHRRLRSQQPPEPEQCEPLAESEAAGWSGRIEPEISAQRVDLCSREFGSQTPPDRTAVAAEAALDEAPVVHGLESVHKRSGSTGEPERDGVNAGSGIRHSRVRVRPDRRACRRPRRFARRHCFTSVSRSGHARSAKPREDPEPAIPTAWER